MSTRVASALGQVISSRDELVAYIEAGSKPRSDWRIGTEHEKFGFLRDGNRPVPYEGDFGIRALLEGLQRKFCWQGIYEQDNLIALGRADCPKGGVISLEPGGQFELSGAPLLTLHDTEAELREHLDEVRQVGDELGIGFLGLGFSPKWSLAEIPVMPKPRYAIMQGYMPKKGKLGLDMMFRTSTVQVNLDFADEADMVAKMRVSLSLQPLATALFANSPFTQGRPNGFKSYRAEIWRDTDADRTGILPFAFEAGMGFERYVDYALDVPMYFVYRDGRYIDVAGSSFRDFLEGRLNRLPGERPTIDDWSDHLTTLFPDVRLKRFLEMRGADTASSLEGLVALPAFWTGILYDDAALAEALALVSDWSMEERLSLRDRVPKFGLATPFRGDMLLPVAREAVAIAEGGLKRRALTNSAGRDESIHLAPLIEIVSSGKTPAERLLANFAARWHGDIDKVFAERCF